MNKLQHILIICSFLGGCTYRFSNYYTKPPENIKSIAFEAAYDTTRSAMNHEILWDELQKAFVKNGSLKVTSVADADAILRIHIRSYDDRQFGRRDTKNEFKDPNPLKDGEPVSPKGFRNLSHAHKIAQNESLSFTLDCELWHLKTKNIIFSRSYRDQERAKIAEVNNKKLIHIRSEEGKEIKLRAASERVANAILSDILNH